MFSFSLFIGLGRDVTSSFSGGVGVKSKSNLTHVSKKFGEITAPFVFLL